MKKRLLLFFLFTILFFGRSYAQFAYFKELKPLQVTTNTKDKPQSKVWNYAGKYWTVLTDSSGTFVWRLDDLTWKRSLQISTSTYGKADCKVVGNVTHVLIFKKTSTYLISVEYDEELQDYKLWSVRTARAPIALDSGAETATIDIDTRGRMWLASDDTTNVLSCNINVRWSDYPYASWSASITLASGVTHDDLGALIAMPTAGKVAVLWSDQNSKRFGFRTHNDEDDPEHWSEDEVPASESAFDIGGGMADDHMNMAVSSDGTLYCAVKTSYDDPEYPRLALLIRRPNGHWDPVYDVTRSGTRPIVLLNEDIGTIKIVYTTVENGGNIIYRESPMADIKFSAPYTLLVGKYNYATSMKQNFSSNVVILASDSIHVVGVLATDKKDKSMELYAYPNPFREKTSVNFSLTETQEYALELYDFKGSKVAVLQQGIARAHEPYLYDLPGTLLADGLYIVRLRTSKQSKILRLIQTR
ncbi:T9SS type A sorting domain-containing protein [Adhaeribacter soli]|uniref:T9SS type A sorting domain-containing protein n=1 Tax=Adhaeribacter soli TaxID=2607655 RepID=A0A5N1J2G8_9BACT|nr:T9SS type A sorting domain-containing protein [Adhaeribacter soli]KAA9340722.1 T9SS type A sorting domain-containing protein [Adhaeribacter soli]